MSCFRRKRTNSTGKKTVDKVWTVEFTDHSGLTRRVSAFTDRAASAELERQLRRLVSLRMGGLGVDIEASRFLEACPEPIKEKLGGWGIISGQQAAAGKAIAEHFTDWRLSMEAKGNSVRHIRNFVSNLKKLAAACKWHYLTDISSADANGWLADQRRAGTSAATINAFLRAGKAFCNWAVKEKRIAENPLKHISLLNADADRRLERHPYSVEELGLLLAAAEVGEKHHGLDGVGRSLVYRLGVETGYRYSEIRSLTRASFDLTGEKGRVTLLAADAKNGQESTQSLREDLTADLRAYFAFHLPHARAFRLWDGKGAAMIHQDLEAAGILKRDENDKLIVTDEYGLVYDFHGLRHTLATMGAKAGIPLAVLQKVMRHSDPRLTSKVYSHIMVTDKADAIEMLPKISAAALNAEENNRTGTDDFSVIKSTDRLRDRKGTDLNGKIRTYMDSQSMGNGVVSGVLENRVGGR